VQEAIWVPSGDLYLTTGDELDRAMKAIFRGPITESIVNDTELLGMMDRDTIKKAALYTSQPLYFTLPGQLAGG
jgi:hypothetical protein